MADPQQSLFDHLLFNTAAQSGTEGLAQPTSAVPPAAAVAVTTATATAYAKECLKELRGHYFNVLSIDKPESVEFACELVKLISKLSTPIGNLIELKVADYLNSKPFFAPLGTWHRQEPAFPDTVLQGCVSPQPGFEVKAWCPLATEITARFRGSQAQLAEDETEVILLAWLPDKLLYGVPRILDVEFVTCQSLAQARDTHYHNPPKYLVVEPEDTSTRACNHQQTNTAGYIWQGTTQEPCLQATKIVEDWGPGGKIYQPTPEYQRRVRSLLNQFPYRLETNFSKIDRVVHPGVEALKTRVLTTHTMLGQTIESWYEQLHSSNDAERIRAIQRILAFT